MLSKLTQENWIAILVVILSALALIGGVIKYFWPSPGKKKKKENGNEIPPKTISSKTIGDLTDRSTAFQAEKIEIGSLSISAPETKPAKQTDSTLQNLPYPSIGSLFKGRDDILNMLNSLLDKKDSIAITQPQTIKGLGGIGKTRLAIEFAWHAFSSKKVNYAFFIASQTPELLDSSLARLSQSLHLTDAKKQDEQLNAVYQFLNSSQNWLMIIDNADDESARNAVQNILPRLAGGFVIITSRYSNWSASVKTQELELLDEASAVSFLLERASERTKTDDDNSLAEQIAELLGRLPLSLEQAAAYINREHISFTEYIEQWQNDKKNVLKWCDSSEMNYPVSAAVTFIRSFEKLTPAARVLLTVSSFLAPEPIPTAMFENKDNKKLLKSETASLAKKLQSKETGFTTQKALADLVDYSLIIKEKSSFTIHRIVQQSVLANLSKTDYRKCLEISLNIVDNFTPTDSDDVRTWPIYDPLRPHLELIALTAFKEKLDEPAGRLMNQIGSYLQAKGLYNESEMWKRNALKFAEKNYGKDNPISATCLNNLALIYKITGRFKEAEPLYRLALEIDEKAFGPDHPNVARDLNNLAQLLKDTNRLSEAEPLMKRGLKIEIKSKGPDHPHVAIQLNNLAALLTDTGRLAEAEPLMRRALKIDEASFGSDHPSIAIRLNNLSALLADTGRQEQALPLYERALKIFENSLGPDHPNTKIVRINYELQKKELKK